MVYRNLNIWFQSIDFMTVGSFLEIPIYKVSLNQIIVEQNRMLDQLPFELLFFWFF